MTRSFILATALSVAASATAWGQTGCEDLRQLRLDKAWEQASAAFDASAAKADEAYREAFEAANASYAQALASVEAAYDGTLYWTFRSDRPADRSAIAEPIAAAAARRAHDRNAAHREWASSMSDMVFRWSASIEEAEARRAAFIRTNVLRIEEQFPDCR